MSKGRYVVLIRLREGVALGVRNCWLSQERKVLFLRDCILTALVHEHATSGRALTLEKGEVMDYLPAENFYRTGKHDKRQKGQ